MAGTPDATMAAVVGAIAAFITTGLSKWIDSRAVDRREASASRRQRDRDQRRDLAECAEENDMLKDRLNAALLENATMRAVLIAKDIPLPEFLTKQLP